MKSMDVLDQTSKKVGEIELNEEVFGIVPHIGAMHQVVVSQLAKARAGTASTKTRSDVGYSANKPYRQKGTGRARAGYRGSPIWRGGGVVFGPHPRKYKIKVPKKVRRLALRSALAGRAQEGKLVIVESLEMETPRTRDLIAILKALNVSGKTLIVTGEFQENLALSGRNIPEVAVIDLELLNVYDVLNMEYLVMTRDAVERISEGLSA
ncbi:MAG: 50S ribosomal protein L4 [Deltaproteobacteria bacterium]|nr:50S ribosomal protein L4 [Deltaproteobacteria bacterium]